MSSLDELFKKPSARSNKRKLEINGHNADAVYKATKTSANGDVKTNGRATVEDEVEDDDDVAAGPELPPDEEEQLSDDDEEGRFFGGGLTRDTADVMDFIDEQDKDETKSEKVDIAWLRKLALNFEKRISKNTELRAKFEDKPEKFMGSEADLDADIKALSILSEHSELYEEFAKLGCVSSLVSLLSHDNTDIAIDSIEIINELTDENVEAEQEQWDALVDAMLEADLLNLLYENISRLNEDIESDRAGIYHVLSVLENLSSRPSIAATLGQKTELLPWLLSRIRRPEPTVSQNKQYAAEMLAILLQSSSEIGTKMISLDGIDAILQLLSPYRKRDPAKGTEEEEYMANIFDCITCLVDPPAGKIKFVEAEGIELCLIMLREGKLSKPRAIRLINHALGGAEDASCCEKLVEAAGLKPTFGLFMKKQDKETTEHLLGILASMLRSLPANEAPRIRLLAKFVEKDYQACDRLVKLRREYASKVAVIDGEIGQERARLDAAESEERADEWFSRRLDAGLYVLQTVDVILAWLVAEDDGARRKIQALAGRDGILEDVRATLQEQVDIMDANPENPDSMLKDMLSTLIKHLI
ncbi:hypothetical protein HO133_009107 [Letharia lupina]|uniref:Beta-catenin-like protein 1 N-terminal domain-containing protein n=1 Tax=Letharia lupina TaxID=560253 RepID=A0A8H6CN27_9LECA|nr:uncharacterized protein HO133_009107 [Letharia lupina]KAF6226241.1 hypothetical protein HO133_009107 [Letharia lupina]